jgi:hypothetical protein
VDWRKILIPLVLTAALSITATVYGISIIPRIENNERGIFKLVEMVLEVRKEMATKEDIRELRVLIKEEMRDDSSDR